MEKIHHPLWISIAISFRKITDQGVELWMQKRQENGPLNGLWEFPGGKIKAGETPKMALIREFGEEVGQSIQAHNALLFNIYPYQYADRLVNLFVFIVSCEVETLHPEGWQFFSWLEKSMPKRDCLPEANLLMIDEVLDYLYQQNQADCLNQLWD